MRRILFAVLLGACGTGESLPTGGSAAPASTAPAAAATAVPSVPQASTAPAPSTAAPPDPAKVDTFRRSLLLGRRLSRAGQHAAAMAALRVALEAMPGHPVALGELGFAALGAGDLALAEQSSREAARNSLDPRHRAASLFNLGTVLERLGRREEAAAAYAKSISLRPNQTVQAALDALGIAAPAPAPPTAVLPAGSLADACVVLERVHTESGGVGVPRCDPATARVVSGSGEVLSAALLSVVAVDPETNGEDGFLHLAVQTTVAWKIVDRVGEWISPGALGMTGECEVKELSVRDLVPGGQPEVVADVECHQRDEDFGICEVSVLTVREATITALEGGQPRIVRRIPVARSFERRALPGCQVEDALRTPGLPDQQGWRGALAFEPGRFSLSVLAGTAPADVVPLVGTKVIESL